MENEVIFWIDAHDEIVSVNSAWDTFASNNGGKPLQGEVLGKKLRLFIVGDSSRMLLDTIVQSVRALRKPATRAYRCDSPESKRFMEMTVTPVGDLIEFRNRCIRIEPLETPLPVQYAPENTDAIKRCSMCNRLNLAERWQDVLEVKRLMGSSLPPLLNVVYDICDDCTIGWQNDVATVC